MGLVKLNYVNISAGHLMGAGSLSICFLETEVKGSDGGRSISLHGGSNYSYHLEKKEDSK